MTAPLRRFLLNKEIAIEARRIAHFATATCCRNDVFGTPPDNDDDHTKNCNMLKHDIETLALQVKLAAAQEREKRVRHRRQINALQLKEAGP